MNKCEHCNGKGLEFPEVDILTVVYLEVDDNELVILDFEKLEDQIPKKMTFVPVSNCPMCGRELEKLDEEEEN